MVSQPPTAEEIINAPKKYNLGKNGSVWEARYLLMTDHWLRQTDAINLCNMQIKKTREFADKHRSLERPNESISDTK